MTFFTVRKYLGNDAGSSYEEFGTSLLRRPNLTSSVSLLSEQHREPIMPINMSSSLTERESRALPSTSQSVRDFSSFVASAPTQRDYEQAAARAGSLREMPLRRDSPRSADSPRQEFSDARISELLEKLRRETGGPKVTGANLFFIGPVCTLVRKAFSPQTEERPGRWAPMKTINPQTSKVQSWFDA